MRDERLHIVEQCRGDMHLEHPALQLVQGLDARYARQRVHELAPIRAAEKLAFRRGRRIAEVHAHEKAIELRLGQREGADLLLRVLELMAGRELDPSASAHAREMAIKEDRVVLRLKPYASFMTPPRHIAGEQDLETLTHWTSSSLPWNAE